MNRYTKRGRSGNVYATGAATVCWGGRTADERLFCVNCHGAKDNRDVDRAKCGPLAIIDRLAAYEDTGLTPEEVAERIRELVTPNNPLTTSELREMDGEPVCVAPVDGGPYTWMLVDVEYEVLRGAHGELAVFEKCGKTWIAYRRKPEDTQ